MESDISRSIAMLHSMKCSIVAIKGNNFYNSFSIGISPIFDKLNEDNKFFSGYCVADKIIGKAAALLLVASDVKCVYGEIMSQSALEVLKRHNVEFSYGELTPHIINRENTGLCPLEKCVLSIDDPSKAYEAVKKKLAELKNKA